MYSSLTHRHTEAYWWWNTSEYFDMNMHVISRYACINLRGLVILTNCHPVQNVYYIKLSQKSAPFSVKTNYQVFSRWYMLFEHVLEHVPMHKPLTKHVMTKYDMNLNNLCQGYYLVMKMNAWNSALIWLETSLLKTYHSLPRHIFYHHYANRICLM